MNLIKTLTFLIVILFTSFTAGCNYNNDSRNLTDMVAIEGSTSMATMLNLLKVDFQKTCNDIPVSVNDSSSKKGLESLLSRKTDIAACSYFENPKKLNRNFRTYVIAYDDIVAIANPSLNISKLDFGQLKQIMLGRQKFWPIKPCKTVNFYIRNNNSGTYEFIRQNLLNNNNFSQQAILVNDSKGVLEAIGGDPDALGFISSYSIANNNKVKRITIVDGGKTVNILRPLYLVCDKKPKPNTQKFIDYCLSPRGKEIIRQSNFRIKP